MTRYSKINFIYLMQKWMDSVPGQTFLNYAYSWGAAVVILGTLFKLTHLPGANTMLFIGMGTEVFVFFISAFDRPFDKTTIDMTLDNHFDDGSNRENEPQQADDAAQNAEPSQSAGVGGGTVIIGGGTPLAGDTIQFATAGQSATTAAGSASQPADGASQPAEAGQATPSEGDAIVIPAVGAPAPAVTAATAAAMEEATTSYVDHLNELNEMLEKVAAQSARLATDSEEMENLNRTLTGISRVYEMQLKSASQQITTQDEINEQIRLMARQIQELNAIYTRMIEAMTVNMSPLAGAQKPQA